MVPFRRTQDTKKSELKEKEKEHAGRASVAAIIRGALPYEAAGRRDADDRGAKACTVAGRHPNWLK